MVYWGAVLEHSVGGVSGEGVSNIKDFREAINLQRSVKYIFKEIRLMNLRNKNKDKIFVILSPASASYDQFRSFEVRGNKFKRLVKKYAKKYF